LIAVDQVESEIGVPNRPSTTDGNGRFVTLRDVVEPYDTLKRPDLADQQGTVLSGKCVERKKEKPDETEHEGSDSR
jgi:hypothetical protein